ncbi:MAG: hypothetical protein HQK98_05300 [Nitrospirae bacterium]|nr:hypothetical protein [Nitrospirota bacterium]
MYKITCTHCGNVVTTWNNRGGRGSCFCRCGKPLHYADAVRVELP